MQLIILTLREYNHFKNKEKIQYILVSRSILDELETNTANDFLDELEGLGIAVKLTQEQNMSMKKSASDLNTKWSTTKNYSKSFWIKQF